MVLPNPTASINNPIWHPFSQMLTGPKAIPIVKAEGAYLYSEDGRKFLDAISSWWVNLHGHTHPYIVEKIRAQTERLEQVIFADFTHQPAFELATRLLSLLPGSMSKVFFSDNGSTAVETALKMAFQYWYNRDPKTPRTRVVCFKHSYHGDTFGAMSVSRSDFHRPFKRYLFDVDVIDYPSKGNEQRSFQQLQVILKRESTACFIFEPLILGVGGMFLYPPAGLDALLDLCHKHSVITIADEVMTGFGRTQTLFACETLSQSPDIFCLSKGLTGGFLPLGVTACKQHIFDAFLSEQLQKALLHGHSYTANPIACSSALASLDLLMSPECGRQRVMITNRHKTFCETWQNHPQIKRCESLGTILVVEILTQDTGCYFDTMRDGLYRFFLNRGVLLRPFGNTLHVIPPYCITEEQLDTIYHLIISAIEETRRPR